MDRVLIRKASEDDLSLAIRFVEAVYQERFGTKPTTIWPECLVAFHEGSLVGVTALQFSRGEPFDIESDFQFDISILPEKREKIVSFGRWVTTERQGVALGLVAAATRYSLSKGRTRMFSCAKPNLLRFLKKKYKLRFDAFAVPINITAIAQEDLNFFTSKPRPQLYSANLHEWYDILERNIPPNVDIQL